MNLADIIQRKDRSFCLISGNVEQKVIKRDRRKIRSVEVTPGTRFRLLRANEFTCLRTFPVVINWVISHGGTFSVPSLRIEVVDCADENRRSQLFESRLSNSKVEESVELSWPSWVGNVTAFDLEISASGRGCMQIEIGRLFDARQPIIPQLKGTGLEVGPGLNPIILPSADVKVRYVEASPAEEWLRLYKKQDKPPRVLTDNLWDRYIVSDARWLDGIEDGSLDFIFSNHVVEHLVNPLATFARWTEKLKPGGVIAGVIPDLRFTFDLRQPPSKRDEWLQERAQVIWEIGEEKYLRWCQYTAPHNTPDDLVARNYSIHVHYYTPETFADLVGILLEEDTVASAYYSVYPNNKDFGFILFTKPESR